MLSLKVLNTDYLVVIFLVEFPETVSFFYYIFTIAIDFAFIIARSKKACKNYLHSIFSTIYDMVEEFCHSFKKNFCKLKLVYI